VPEPGTYLLSGLGLLALLLGAAVVGAQDEPIESNV